ncbi:MAG: hypothetical protein CMP25_02190 [Rickettsiales bacterium]|mgnify:CR=1 FL=1|nr:hypothetical protein [Rickettsiales bacterium]|tara:strand:- start:3331 stop:4182 length:852 start_codon:yes stop_codon:yes gene_type:complete
MYVLIALYCLIQGFTEFLPVSSQAHLIVFNNFYELELNGLSMRSLNIMAHFGSLLAIITYYFRDCITLILSVKNFFQSYLDPNTILLKSIIYASLPLFFIGYFAANQISENFLESLVVIGWISIIFGILLYFVDKYCLRIKHLDRINLTSSLAIGFFQSLAIVPGFSRSGAVLTIMRFFGFTRSDSVKFSNLLSIPAIGGATIYLILNLETVGNNPIEFFNFYNVLIILLSFSFSIFFIHFLVSWVQKSSLAVFMWYRIIFGIFIIIYSNIDLSYISWNDYLQ